MNKYINERPGSGEAPCGYSGEAVKRCTGSNDPGWVFVFIAFIVFIVFIAIIIANSR